MLTDVYRPADRVPVRRVHTANGSHIEPELSADLTDLCKLEWQAAVVEHDTGIPILFGPARWTINGQLQSGVITIQIGRSASVHYVDVAWEYLSAISVGAQEAFALIRWGDE